MGCNGELRRTRTLPLTMQGAASKPTMKRPTRAKSLLVDYSKMRASAEDVDHLNDLFSCSGHTENTTEEEDSSSSSNNNEHSSSSFSLPGLTTLPSDGKTAAAPKPKPAAAPKPKPAAPKSSFPRSSNERHPRRAQLQTSRKYQSMSNLNFKPVQNQNVLSFSLRRRKTVTTGSSNIDSTHTPLRSRTWDNITTSPPSAGSSSCARFHNSLGNLNLGDLNLEDLGSSSSNLNTAITETAAAAAATSPSASNTTPAQNRRSMLVRHSSVSALTQSQHNNHTMDSWAPSTPTQSIKRRASSSRRQLMSPSSSSKADILKDLPSSILITPRSNGTNGRMRDLSLGRHSLRGGSSHRTRRPPQLATSRHQKKEDPMSASNHSFFHSSRPERRASGAPSRRDLMGRQMSSRRNVGRTFSTASGTTIPSCPGSNDMMDDSSHFVTGSRIRRGMSARHLFGPS